MGINIPLRAPADDRRNLGKLIYALNHFFDLSFETLASTKACGNEVQLRRLMSLSMNREKNKKLSFAQRKIWHFFQTLVRENLFLTYNGTAENSSTKIFKMVSSMKQITISALANARTCTSSESIFNFQQPCTTVVGLLSFDLNLS